MSNAILQTLQAKLALGFKEQEHNPTFKPAAVLVLLAPAGKHLAVVLTKRSSRIAHQPGEISFPGGRWEPADANLLATALRETHEEIGVAPEQVTVLGAMPRTIIARAGYVISPFVGALKAPCQFKPNPDEVEELFSVPIGWLLDPAHRTIETRAARPYPIAPEYDVLPNYSYQYG